MSSYPSFSWSSRHLEFRKHQFELICSAKKIGVSKERMQPIKSLRAKKNLSYQQSSRNEKTFLVTDRRTCNAKIDLEWYNGVYDLISTAVVTAHSGNQMFYGHYKFVTKTNDRSHGKDRIKADGTKVEESAASQSCKDYFLCAEDHHLQIPENLEEMCLNHGVDIILPSIQAEAKDIPILTLSSPKSNEKQCRKDEPVYLTTEKICQLTVQNRNRPLSARSNASRRSRRASVGVTRRHWVDELTISQDGESLTPRNANFKETSAENGYDSINYINNRPPFICPSSEEKSQIYMCALWVWKSNFKDSIKTIPLV